MTTKHPSTVLIIAGNDPSGGAGICADTQAISALGAHPAPVLSSLTVQDTVNAYAVEAMDADFVAAQARKVLEDMPISAIKLGLLGTAAIGKAVAELLREHPDIPVVTDPVLVAAGGAELAERELIETYLDELLPLTTILTPNAVEIRDLAPGLDTTRQRVDALLEKGCRYVLAKGGDEDTPDVKNALYDNDGIVGHYDSERLAGSYHGSGCTLASSIAAGLAKGLTPELAVAEGQAFTFGALKRAWKPSHRDGAQFIPLRRAFD
ncbi:MAG: hydroxymethylpyrimidine/phosphomethylpyrimidine kinase [Gammaproteobacteria bacterium]|nr:hydroxymethylpyrimidine/phosphomethylpyrimidine kinase [Gammaproteobacteria bacterium]